MAYKGPELETQGVRTYLFWRQYVSVSVGFSGEDREQPAVQLFELSKSSQHGPLLPNRSVSNLNHRRCGRNVPLGSSCPRVLTAYFTLTLPLTNSLVRIYFDRPDQPSQLLAK